MDSNVSSHDCPRLTRGASSALTPRRSYGRAGGLLALEEVGSAAALDRQAFGAILESFGGGHLRNGRRRCVDRRPTDQARRASRSDRGQMPGWVSAAAVAFVTAAAAWQRQRQRQGHRFPRERPSLSPPVSARQPRSRTRQSRLAWSVSLLALRRRALGIRAAATRS